MSHKFKHKVTLSREEAANRIRTIADALGAGGEVTLELDGESIAAQLPDTVRFEFELEDNELEIELKWEQTTPSPPRSEPAAATSSQAPSSPAGTAASSRPSGGDDPVNYGLAGQASGALVTTASQSSSEPSGGSAI